VVTAALGAAPHFRLGGRRRGDFLDLVVLERRDLGGLGDRLLVQGAAALLVFLGEEVGLLGFFSLLKVARVISRFC
jgi:hypothetical protein